MQDNVVKELVFEIRSVENLFDMIRYFCVDRFVKEFLGLEAKNFFGSFLEYVKEFMYFLFWVIET